MMELRESGKRRGRARNRNGRGRGGRGRAMFGGFESGGL